MTVFEEADGVQTTIEGCLRGDGIAAVSLAIALGCVGCSQQMAYVGTGSLQTSGVTAMELATQTLTFTQCDGDGPDANASLGGPTTAQTSSSPYAILAIGSECTINGAGAGEGFRMNAAAPCTLVFAEGRRTLKVTDVTIRHGAMGPGLTSRAYFDANYIELQLGGDDVKTGGHVVYRFSGHSTPVSDDSSPCVRTPTGPSACFSPKRQCGPTG